MFRVDLERGEVLDDLNEPHVKQDEILTFSHPAKSHSAALIFWSGILISKLKTRDVFSCHIHLRNRHPQSFIISSKRVLKSNPNREKFYARNWIEKCLKSRKKMGTERLLRSLAGSWKGFSISVKLGMDYDWITALLLATTRSQNEKPSIEMRDTFTFN